MKKSLLAIAIAAALPAVASAQVTISGYAKGSFDSFSIGNKAADRLGKTSENRVTDHSSRIIFSANEAIDNDLSGVFQFDLRFNVDQVGRISATEPASGTSHLTAAQRALYVPVIQNAVPNPLSSGNNHVGIVSKSMGALRFGRQDIYYGNTGSVLPSSVHINASAPTVMHQPATNVSMANWSRTPNLIWYTSPTIQGWSATAGYSTNPLRTSGTNETENDLSTLATVRKGGGTFFQVNGQVGPVALAWATVNLKSDYWTTNRADCTYSNPDRCWYEQTNNSNGNQRGNVLTAIYRGGPIALGVGYSQNEVLTFTNNKTERNAFNLSAAYTMGKHTLGIERQSGSDEVLNGVKQGETGMTGTVLAWDYAFSKRTNIGITYFELENDRLQAIAPFYSGSNTFGGQMAARPGEKYTLTSFVMRHTW